MKHKEMMEIDEEYKRTYDVLLDSQLSIEKIIEVVVKSNGIVGVGIVSFKDGINHQLDNYMKGYWKMADIVKDELDYLSKVDLGSYYGIEYSTESVVEDLLRIISTLNDKVNNLENKDKGEE